MEKYFETRFNGFYFWTMKKNFLSLYIYSQLKQEKDLLEIFKWVISKTVECLDVKRKEKCIKEWDNFNHSYAFTEENWKKPKYITNGMRPHAVLNFLYNYKYNIEEFCVYMVENLDNIEMEKLLYDAMTVFTEIHYYTEHCSCPGQYTMSHYCPIKSVNAPKDFNWNEYLIELQKYQFIE